MPRITASTMREHRANVRATLIDTAEHIMRTDGSHALTAGAVTAAVGIARNSIYRYVDSVDDLRALVLERHLPSWLNAVNEAVTRAHTPAEQIDAWCRSNLEQAATTGHGWLMNITKNTPLTDGTRQAVAHAHRNTQDMLLTAWQHLTADDTQAQIGAELTRSMVDAGFRLLDRGMPAEHVITATLNATSRLHSSGPTPQHTQDQSVAP
ncbi:TetR/AcrR family transcriptional regulator [Dermatophilus congolensis]|uniref:TetR/AcrR family transcriptional regulator n=1 Tax=Dermatophilus congolensis TaxID=1863 RepID=UPI001AB05918|nr:TetR/AcrR family transcriptional regulator [Dermatophilus congolensis]